MNLRTDRWGFTRRTLKNLQDWAEAGDLLASAGLSLKVQQERKRSSGAVQHGFFAIAVDTVRDDGSEAPVTTLLSLTFDEAWHYIAGFREAARMSQKPRCSRCT